MIKKKEISEETIERIDVAVENLKNGKVSEIVDLSDFVEAKDTKSEKGK